jgi:hypothetical protein
MDAHSRALRRAMNGVMADLIAAMMATVSVWLAGAGTGGCFEVDATGFGAGVSELALSLGMSSRVMPRLGGVFFFGRGVGEGSARGGWVGVGVKGRPLGVDEGDGCFAAWGGFVLVGVGVEVLGVGTLPDAVHFWPMDGVWMLSNGPSKTALRPRDIAADMKYEPFRFLTALAISAS